MAIVAFGIGAVSWMVARLYLQIIGVRHAPQTYSSLVIAQKGKRSGNNVDTIDPF